jgi:hypothetical protein
MRSKPPRPHHRILPTLFAAWALTGCAEQIDETGDPIEVGAQRRTEVEIPCKDEDDCTRALAIESAESKDDDVIDVVEFGDGFVLVEGVGPGDADVLAKGEGKRVRIHYAVSESADGSGELEVEQVELELVDR